MKLKFSSDTRTWWAHFKSEAGDQSVNTGTGDKKKAAEVCRLAKIEELEKAASVMRLTADVVSLLTCGRSITMAEALEKYVSWMKVERSSRTTQSAEAVLKAFIRENNLSTLNPNSIKPETVTAYINRPELKLSTRKIQRSIINGFFDFCSQSGWSIGNPAARAPIDFRAIPLAQKERVRKELFTADEIAFLKARLTGFWRSAVILSSELGIRLSDVCSLEWGSFDFKRGKVVIWMEKTDERVELEMTRAVKELAVSLPQTHKRWVFPEEHESYERAQSTLSWQFKRICASLGFEGRSFHCLRASYATDEYARLANSNVDEAAMTAVAKRLGHKSTDTTERHYVKVGGK